MPTYESIQVRDKAAEDFFTNVPNQRSLFFHAIYQCWILIDSQLKADIKWIIAVEASLGHELIGPDRAVVEPEGFAQEFANQDVEYIRFNDHVYVVRQVGSDAHVERMLVLTGEQLAQLDVCEESINLKLHPTVLGDLRKKFPIAHLRQTDVIAILTDGIQLASEMGSRGEDYLLHTRPSYRYFVCELDFPQQQNRAPVYTILSIVPFYGMNMIMSVGFTARRPKEMDAWEKAYVEDEEDEETAETEEVSIEGRPEKLEIGGVVSRNPFIRDVCLKGKLVPLDFLRVLDKLDKTFPDLGLDGKFLDKHTPFFRQLTKDGSHMCCGFTVKSPTRALVAPLDEPTLNAQGFRTIVILTLNDKIGVQFWLQEATMEDLYRGGHLKKW